MQLNRLQSTAALSAVLLFCATPLHAQGRPLTANGHGSYVSPTIQNTVRFVFQLTELSSGAVHGIAVWRGPHATFIVKLGSAMFLPGTQSLATAGRITEIIGTPRGVLANAKVGDTAFFAVNDHGGTGPDETSGFSVMPPLSAFPPILFQLFPQLGDLTTIQQIALLGQLLNVPPPVWRPLITGDIRISR